MADRQKRTINDVDVESTEDDEARPTKRRKARTSINHLSELRPGTQYHLVGQYGGPESPTYVMQITVDSKLFQGVGPSKKRAKLMAAEFALVDLGAITTVTDVVPDISQEPYCYDDFTADINDTNSLLYYDFYAAERTQGEGASAVAGEGAGTRASEERSTFESKMIGKNTLTILRELHPSSFYHFVTTVMEDARPRFIMGVNVDGQRFKGSGINKRLAKARAAREALRKIDKMEFGMAEDGMPVYEGDEKIWLDYKAKLESEAEAKLENVFGDNPIQQLNEYFPEAKITFPDTAERPDIESFFVCQVVVEGSTYEGSGLSKKDAKIHASALALNDLKERGVLAEKDRELEAKRVERDEKKKVTEKIKGNAEQRKVGGFKTAVAKLNDSFQNLEYKLVAETPLKSTCLIAFTMAIRIHGKNYVGVGKNKKMAKLDAAEKALRDLGMWTEEDEAEKVRMKKEEENLDVEENEEWGATTGQVGQGKGWNQGEVYVGGWGGGGGGGGNNWDARNSQYGGYGCGYNAGWGGGDYGPGVAGQQGGWGPMDPCANGGYGTYPPMMQELSMIMGNMFESTFGQNPWKVNNDGVGGQQHQGGGQQHQGWGFGGRPGQGFQSRGNFNNNNGGNIGGGSVPFDATPIGLNLPETSSSATTSFSSSVNTSAPFGENAVVNSEPYRGQGCGGRGASRGGSTSSRGTFEHNSGGSSKYSNFRSAGFDTGFKPPQPVQTTAGSNTEGQAPIVTPTFGPYGTLITPPPPVTGQGDSAANLPKSGFPVVNMGGGYDAGAGNQATGNTGTANNTTNAFHGSAGFPMVGGFPSGNTPPQGGYQSATSEGYQASGANNSMMQQQYQGFMSSYPMTGSGEGFSSGNSAGAFPAVNTTASGYSSGNYSSGDYSSGNYSSGTYSSGTTGGYQSGSLDTNYSNQASAYGNQVAALSAQSTGYQGSQTNYSAGSYQGDNTTRGSYAGESFQGQTSDGGYSADPSGAGYYGMYGSGYDQGYNYDSTTGSYDTNTGYSMGGYQNNTGTNTGYGYGYSTTTGNSTATDSQAAYSTVTNRTTW